MRRILYGIEFFVALPAVLVAWSQIGGAAHFDAVDWQWKLACSVGFAWSAMRLTAAAGEPGPIWTRRFVLWSLGTMVLALTMGWQSYQVHLTEAADEVEMEDDAETKIQPTERPLL